MKKNVKYLVYLFTLLVISSLQSVKAASCTIYIDSANDSVTYNYSDVLKKCNLTPPFSNPKVIVHSGSSHIKYGGTSYNFTISGLKNLKAATSEYADITFKNSSSAEQTINVRFSLISHSSDSAKTSICCKLPSGSYKTYSGTSCGRYEKVDNSFCSSSTETPAQETPACYQYSNGLKAWGTETQVKNKANGLKYTQTSDSQSDCTRKNAETKRANDAQEAANATGVIASGATSTTDYGTNSCSNYIINRERGYNTTKNGFSYVKDDYFRSAIGLSGQTYQYYYVYKARYNCEGYDTSKVTAFCVDPGVKGAENSGTAYKTGGTITTDTPLGKGLYHLYTYWYLGHKSEISSTYHGSSPNGAEDLVDYVINNVARQLISNYGSTEISFTKPLQSGDGTQSSLTKEYNAYKTGTVGVDAASSLKSKDILTRVWQDTEAYANGTKTEEETHTEVKFVIQQDSANTKNSKKGFDTEFTVTIKSEDKNILESIKNNYKITASVIENNVEKDISGAITSSMDASGWQMSTDGTTMTGKFKASAEDIYSYVSSSSIGNVKVNFNITYSDPRSIKNILYLTPVSGGYQKFITFLNKDIPLKQSVQIDMGNAEKSSCKPTFAMPCTGPENVVYLIEGTQSGTLFNSVMAGLNSVEDVKNVISSAYQMVEILKNNGLSKLGDSELELIGGMIYNLADKVGISLNIKSELAFLGNMTNNNTARSLYNALNKISTSNDAKQNYSILQQFFIESLSNVIDNGYKNLVDEYKQIMDAAEIQLADKKMSQSTYELLETIQNLIKSSNNGSTLSSILTGVKTLSEQYLSKLTDIDSIKSMAVSFTSTISNTIQSASGNITNIYNQLANTYNNIKNSTSLTDISISNLYDSLTSTFQVNWEKCIIGENNIEATDPSGNSYTVQAQNMYCKVVCKEDYAIKLPGNLGTVYAGQNLTTNLDNVYHATVGMAGQRTCVTTKIDNDAYASDAAELKDNILEAYNRFQKNYAAYLTLKTQVVSESVDNLDKTAFNTKEDPFDGAEVTLKTAEARYKVAMSNKINSYLEQVINPKNEQQREFLESMKQSFNASLDDKDGSEDDDDNNAGMVSKLLSTYVQKDEGITSSDVETVLKSAMKNYTNNLDESSFLTWTYNNKFNSNLPSISKSLSDELGKISEEVGLASIKRTYGTNAVQKAISGACKFLTKVPFIRKGAKVVCNTAATATTMVSDAITGVSEKTSKNLKVFNFHNYDELGSLAVNYNKYKYTDSSDNLKKLQSSITDLSDLVSEQVTIKGDTHKLWVISKGSYDASSTYYGWTLHLDMLKKAKNSFSKLKQADMYVLSDTLNSLSNMANKINNKKSYGAIKSARGEIEEMNNSGILEQANDIINKVLSTIGTFDDITSGLQIDITNFVDNALDGIYYLLGTFNPYYYQIALIREQMAQAKQDYDTYRGQLEKLASNMNQCTMFDNEYQFDPDLVFSYGTSSNSVSDYILNKKNATTDQIRLAAINKQTSPETVTYYCKEDVPINKIQDISTIVSGKCSTSDGMIGGVVASVFGSDSEMATILKKFQQNSSGLRTLLNNEKVKNYINNSGYAEKLDNFLCTGLGSSFCGLVGSKESADGSLITNVPGDIVYTVINSKNNTQTNLTTGLWGIIKNGLSGGLKEIDRSITNQLRYTTTTDNKFTYRDAKRVVSISRYGNPGVSISGLSWSSLLSNIATWISSETNSSSSGALSKVNDTVMSVTGQGAQKFIYYESTQKYWTSSNKGVYTKASTSEDSVYIDLGDKALTDDKIKTADGSKKEANGKVFPIALSTQPGTYRYNITINNVGQYYNNTMNLGRIIDNKGYISGILANKYVCKYEVKAEPKTPDNSCTDILESSDCRDNNGYFKDYYRTNPNDKLYGEKQTACINKLLATGSTCCSYIDENSVPDGASDIYNKYCKNNSNGTPCSGIKLYGEDSAIQTTITNKGNSALISNSGTLQFYTKVVSNYDLFPNGNSSKGYNWNGKTSGYENKKEDGSPDGQDLSKIIEDIQKAGDGIYADTDVDSEGYLQYSITMNSACMNAIKAYNKNQEIIDLGFGDYSASSISKESREYKSQFLADIQSKSEYSSCKIDGYLK